MTQALATGTAHTDDQIFEMTSCRVILQHTLLTKQKKNSRYSLRAFARDLRVSPSFLSEVLNGKYGISRQLAHQIAEKLGFDQAECAHFCELAETEVTESRTRRRHTGTPKQDNVTQSLDLNVTDKDVDTKIEEVRDAIQRMMRQSRRGTFMLHFRS